MNNEMLMRQRDLIPDGSLSTSVVIIGCGGIGSHTAMALARMGMKDVTIIDPDTVSIHNVSSQGFDVADVGKSKVDVTRSKIMRATRTVVKTSKALVRTVSDMNLHDDIYILAVDSMASRKDIFGLLESRNAIVINPAMGAEIMTMDVYDMTSASANDDFKARWFSDDDGVQEECTSKATIYTTLLISSFIAKVAKDVITSNDYTRRIVYDIKNNRPTEMWSSNDDNLLE